MGAKLPQFCRLQHSCSSLQQGSQMHSPAKMVAASLQPCNRSHACQLEGKLGQAGQIWPNWGCSDECAVRSQEDKDTTSIPGHSARPLVGQSEGSEAASCQACYSYSLENKHYIGIPMAILSARRLHPQQETLSMETWVGRILWKPPSQMHS